MEGFGIFILVAGLVVGLLWYVSNVAAQKDRADEERRRHEEIDRVSDICKEIMRQHIDVLARKYVTLVRKNEYGVFEFDAWNAEIGRYAHKILGLELFKRGITSLDNEDLILYAEAAFDELSPPAIEAFESAQSTFRDDMTGVEYEALVATILTENGWDVATTKATGDQGVDLIASMFDRHVAIQCKRHGQKVGNAAVQEAATGARHYGCAEAWVVSNADYTPAARQLAHSVGVKLLHHAELAEA